MTHSDQRTFPHPSIALLIAIAFIVAVGVSQSRQGFAADVTADVTELNDPGLAIQPADRLGVVEPPPPPTPEGLLIFPLEPESDCYILDNFGDARGSTRLHEGIDIMGSEAQPVLAVADGVLTKRYTNTGTAGWGWTLYDEVADTTYKYFHMADDANGLEEGDAVDLGDVIGYVGDSGTTAGNFHLHFEVRRGEGSSTTAKDPLPLLFVDSDVCGISESLRA
jgi:murein DD-endopeptidase MepM/ murein hydrolase activator NlpD